MSKTFLIIEDDANDAFLMRRAFAGLAEYRVFVCRSGSEAKAYLRGAGMYAQRDIYPFPDAIISDLRLGHESGIHLLLWLRSATDYASLPFVIISGSASPSDIETAQKLGARTFRKPVTTTDLRAMLNELFFESGELSECVERSALNSARR